MAYPKKERMDYRISPTYMSFMEYGGVKLNLINLIVTWTKCTVLNLIKKKMVQYYGYSTSTMRLTLSFISKKSKEWLTLQVEIF